MKDKQFVVVKGALRPPYFDGKECKIPYRRGKIGCVYFPVEEHLSENHGLPEFLLSFNGIVPLSESDVPKTVHRSVKEGRMPVLMYDRENGGMKHLFIAFFKEGEFTRIDERYLNSVKEAAINAVGGKMPEDCIFKHFTRREWELLSVNRAMSDVFEGKMPYADEKLAIEQFTYLSDMRKLSEERINKIPVEIFPYIDLEPKP